MHFLGQCIRFRQSLLLLLTVLILALADGSTISPSKANYAVNEDVVVTWTYENGDARAEDWIGIYSANQATPLPAGATMWEWVDGRTSVSFSDCLDSGEYRVHIVRNEASPYPVVATSETFAVNGNESCDASCPKADVAISPTAHLPPSEGMVIDKIAFSSCYKPAFQKNNQLWKHLREQFCIDPAKCVWDWLGDNMYYDTSDMNLKRQAYNDARDDRYYSEYGPVAEPKIPTSGTWDDHDYAYNNLGKTYSCREQSQDEFCHHFNVPETDPRHPNQGSDQQEGIYSSYVFNKDDGKPGIHLINLDARYHRSPTFPSYGECEGAASTILGEDQWDWLAKELRKNSEVKVIGSGIQVLPPTNQNDVSSFCSYDGEAGTFVNANLALEEGPGISGTSFESWGEIPQERLKLLSIVQESIAEGHTKQVVFISGDQHWAEIMMKELPETVSAAGNIIPAAKVYEVTASGIDQWWPFSVSNPNRINVRRADAFGWGGKKYECIFPFQYGGETYEDCSSADHNAEWCYTSSIGTWGNCEPKKTDLIKVSASKEYSCDDALHVCNAQANYGGINVNWAQETLTLSIFTPHAATDVAGSVTIAL